MLSLNEVGSLALKAARGAGIPLGQAEDLGRVAAYFAATSGDITPVTRALTEPLTLPEVDWDNDRITVKSGAAALVAPIIRDAFAMGYCHAILADLTHGPFVAATLAVDGVALSWDGPAISRSDTNVIKPVCKPVAIPAQDWAIWQDLSARTYVPESAESRLAGAGAGLNDND